MGNSNKDEKEGTLAVQSSKPKKLNGHKYKQLLKSMVNKAKESDLPIQKKRKLSQSEVNTESNGSNIDETTNKNSSFSHSQRKRVDFLLRRVKYSGHQERSNSSEHVTQTKKRKSNILESKCSLDICMLKEKLAHVAYDYKSTTTTFVEYWVPIRLSNMQTEQYCGSLFSNASVLCSSLKHDSTEILHDILVLTRKCCDHPYLVDWSLRTYLIQGIPEPEILDAEIKLSNKLLLLHKILLEIKKRGLRVLILYQSLRGSGPISTGDILDDIIHEKFGEESFVRIGGEISPSKKRAVLNTFNGKGSEKFVCLMDTRSCVPSIKLESIDTVIFFNSDWNPMNDLRALQKISLHSQFEKVKVFRLYSTYTVEEKVLILAKEGMAPEGNIINIKQSTRHGLLTWGASYLFKRLEKLHNFSTPDIHSFISDGDSFLDDVFLELSSILPNNDKNNVFEARSLILEVPEIGGAYPKNISVLGEVENNLPLGKCSSVKEMRVKKPHIFWLKLLERRNPRWKYFSSQSPRIRKSVQRFDDLLEESAGAETASKKCWTEADTVCQIPAIMRRRTRKKLQSRDNRRKLSGSKKHALTRWRIPMLGKPSSTEPHSLLPPNEHDHMPSSTTIQNNHIHGTTSPSLQTEAASVSSVQPCMAEVPLQTASITSHMTGDRREPSVSATSLNCQPSETSQVTHPEALKYVCKALEIELERLEKQRTETFKLHENMKLQTEMACAEEIAQIRKKHEMLLQNAEMAFVEEKEVFDIKYNKICINKSLAEALMQSNNFEIATLLQVQNLPTSSGPGCPVVQELRQASGSERITSRSNQLCATVWHPLTSSEVANCQLAVQQSFQTANQSSVAAPPDQPLASPCNADPQLTFNCSLSVQRTSGITPGQGMYPGSGLETGSLSISPMQHGTIQPLAINLTNADTTLAVSQALSGHRMAGPHMNSTSFGKHPQAPVGLSTISFSLMPSIPLSGNLQGPAMREPAPHLRHIWHPLATTTPRISSPGAGIVFSPVNLRPVTPNVQPRQSPGLISCSSSSPFGLPLLEYR